MRIYIDGLNLVLQWWMEGWVKWALTLRTRNTNLGINMNLEKHQDSMDWNIELNPREGDEWKKPISLGIKSLQR
jgi:hypothetical protein